METLKNEIKEGITNLVNSDIDSQTIEKCSAGCYPCGGK